MDCADAQRRAQAGFDNGDSFAMLKADATREIAMDQKTFETELQRDGYRQIEVKSFPPGHRPGHAHDFDVRGLVLDGELTIEGEGLRQTYRPGEMFAMPAHIAHTEDIGPKGVRFIYGRRG